MPEEKRGEKREERMSVLEAQDAIAAAIPEIERLAWRFFTISRDLQAPEQDEDFEEQEPGPEHLRWFTALGALATYSELMDLIPYARKTAECTDADLMREWEGREELDARAARP